MRTTEYDCIMAALNHVLVARWDGRQKAMAIDSGISESMLSNIISGKRNAGAATVIKIARQAGYEHPDFIALGKSILETGQPPAAAKAVKPADRPPPAQQYSLDERMLRVLESIDKRLEAMEKRQEEIEKRKIVPLGERKGRR